MLVSVCEEQIAMARQLAERLPPEMVATIFRVSNVSSRFDLACAAPALFGPLLGDARMWRECAIPREDPTDIIGHKHQVGQVITRLLLLGHAHAAIACAKAEGIHLTDLLRHGLVFPTMEERSLVPVELLLESVPEGEPMKLTRAGLLFGMAINILILATMAHEIATKWKKTLNNMLATLRSPRHEQQVLPDLMEESTDDIEDGQNNQEIVELEEGEAMAIDNAESLDKYKDSAAICCLRLLNQASSADPFLCPPHALYSPSSLDASVLKVHMEAIATMEKPLYREIDGYLAAYPKEYVDGEDLTQVLVEHTRQRENLEDHLIDMYSLDSPGSSTETKDGRALRCGDDRRRSLMNQWQECDLLVGMVKRAFQAKRFDIAYVLSKGNGIERPCDIDTITEIYLEGHVDLFHSLLLSKERPFDASYPSKLLKHLYRTCDVDTLYLLLERVRTIPDVRASTVLQFTNHVAEAVSSCDPRATETKRLEMIELTLDIAREWDLRDNKDVLRMSCYNNICQALIVKSSRDDHFLLELKRYLNLILELRDNVWPWSSVTLQRVAVECDSMQLFEMLRDEYRMPLDNHIELSAASRGNMLLLSNVLEHRRETSKPLDPFCLPVAYHHGHAAVVDFLLREVGAPEDDSLIMEDVIRRDDMKMFERLQQHGMQLTCFTLHMAISLQHDSLVDDILQHRPDLMDSDAFLRCVELSHEKAATYLEKLYLRRDSITEGVNWDHLFSTLVEEARENNQPQTLLWLITRFFPEAGDSYLIAFS